MFNDYFLVITYECNESCFVLFLLYDQNQLSASNINKYENKILLYKRIFSYCHCANCCVNREQDLGTKFVNK